MNTEIFDLGKIGITIGGEYDNKAIYEKLTIVLYKGKSYISTKTTQGISPEEDIRSWQLVAEAKDAYHMLVDAGKTTLTEEEFLEQLVDATKGRYIVQGNIINAADEEDLTVEHSDLLCIDTLKLANRDNTNGMGYVILRKNKSFAEQVTKENTIYEIRYEFVVGGTNDNPIKIGKGSILKFVGGTLSNGHIECDNIFIDAQPVYIFKSVTLHGTFATSIGYPEWFGAKIDKTINSREAIQSSVNNFKTTILSGMYGINALNIEECIVVPAEHHIIGMSSPKNTTSACGLELIDLNSNTKVIVLNNGCRCENILIVGLCEYNLSHIDEKCIGIFSSETNRIMLKNIYIYNCSTGVSMISYITTLERVLVSYCNIGFKITGGSSLYTSCTLINCYCFRNKIAGYYLYRMTYSSLINCACDSSGLLSDDIVTTDINFKGAYYLERCYGITLLTIGSEGCVRFLNLIRCTDIGVYNYRAQTPIEKIGVSNIESYMKFTTCSGCTINGSIEWSQIPSNWNEIYIWYQHYKTQQKINEFGSNVQISNMKIISDGIISADDLLEDIRLCNTNINEVREENINKIIENSTRKRILKYELSNNNPRRYLGYHNKKDYIGNTALEIVGVDESYYPMLLDGEKGALFEGFESVVFKNLNFTWNAANPLTSYFLKFKNTKVTFVKCKFTGLKDIKNLICAENALVTFENTYIQQEGESNCKIGDVNYSIINYENLPESYFIIDKPALRLPFNTKVYYSNNTIGICKNSGIAVAPFSTTVNNVSELNVLTSTLSIGEKALAISSECWVSNVGKKYFWTGTKWVDTIGADI